MTVIPFPVPPVTIDPSGDRQVFVGWVMYPPDGPPVPGEARFTSQVSGLAMTRRTPGGSHVADAPAESRPDVIMHDVNLTGVFVLFNFSVMPRAAAVDALRAMANHLEREAEQPGASGAPTSESGALPPP